MGKPSGGGTVAIISGDTQLLYIPGSRYAGGDSFSYTISDGYGGSSTATIYIRNPYLAYAGSFQSAISGSVPGYLTVTLGSQGAFTGSLRILGSSYSIKGSMNAAGNAVITIARGKLPALVLTLSIPLDGSGPTITR